MSDNTVARLQALHDQLVLDTSPNSRYNKIVAFAAAEFKVPMALISLVDNGRPWFWSVLAWTAVMPGMTSHSSIT